MDENEGKKRANVPESDHPSGEGVVCEMMMVRPIAGNLHSHISGSHILDIRARSRMEEPGSHSHVPGVCVTRRHHQATDFRPYQVHIDHPI